MADTRKATPSREAALADALAYKLNDIPDALPPERVSCSKTAAKAPNSVRAIAELGQVVAALDADPAKLGLVLDTCHLHVAGFDLAAPDAP